MRFFTLLIVLCTGPSFSLISHRALNSVQTRHLQQRLTDTDAASTTTWVADGLSQSDLMHKDECIVVNERDSILGHRSKYDTHKFTAGNPAGVLHRAFSVFLFDAQGRLLLQKRAASKITFPGVWTNTCCSHPLYGYQPCEVDDAESVSSGSVLGVRHAAIRKLQHELGIAEGRFSVGDFKYLTRLHYSAPDEFTRGTAADPSTSEEEKASDPFRCWGESEVDYILLLRADDLALAPNVDEIEEVRYVTLPELRAMMDPASGLRWSPWFRLIAEHFLPQWWADLDATTGSDLHVDLSTIHRL